MSDDAQWEVYQVPGDPTPRATIYCGQQVVAEIVFRSDWGVDKRTAGGNAARIVDCFNACREIEDPATALQAAREALEVIAHNIASLCGAYPDRYPRHAFQGTLDLARSALAALDGKEGA